VSAFDGASVFLLHMMPSPALKNTCSLATDVQGSCAGFEFKAGLEKASNLKTLKKSLNCF